MDHLRAPRAGEQAGAGLSPPCPPAAVPARTAASEGLAGRWRPQWALCVLTAPPPSLPTLWAGRGAHVHTRTGDARPAPPRTCRGSGTVARRQRTLGPRSSGARSGPGNTSPSSRPGRAQHPRSIRVTSPGVGGTRLGARPPGSQLSHRRAAPRSLPPPWGDYRTARRFRRRPGRIGHFRRPRHVTRSPASCRPVPEVRVAVSAGDPGLSQQPRRRGASVPAAIARGSGPGSGDAAEGAVRVPAPRACEGRSARAEALGVGV